MKSPIARGIAALLIAATALTAACSNNDPTAPAAPSTARTPDASGPARSSGYIVAWGRDGGATSGTSTGTSTTGTTGGMTTNSGYIVAWGRDGSASQPAQPAQ